MGCSSSRTENPLLSTQHVIDVNGQSLPTYNDEHFSKVRGQMGLSDSFLTAFFFSGMKPGGGKGGQLLGFTSDKLWVVKELNDTDHNTLLDLGPAYVEHVTHPDGSLLCKVVAHFHDPEQRKNFMAMNNVTPPLAHQPSSALTVSSETDEREVQAGAPPTRKLNKRASYDLKGCADDKTLEQDGERLVEVHKRVWHVHMWCGKCCWNSNRIKYYQGKKHAMSVSFHVTPAQQGEIETWMKRDCSFLSDWGLMDYSLMVSATKVPLNEPEAQYFLDSYASRAMDTLPFINVYDGQVQVLSLGIIDFLQDWTCGKRIANCIKCCETNKATVHPQEYAARFVKYLQGKFRGDADEGPAGANGL